MSVVTPFPGQSKRRVVRSHEPLDRITGATADLEEIAREHAADPHGIMQAVARIRRAVAELKDA